MKKTFFLLAVLFFFGARVFAQVPSVPTDFSSSANSARNANRRTAIRYLQLAKQYASQKQWKEADSNARLGLAYDDTIADLWYIRSVSQFHSGEKKANVLPLIVTALTSGAEWTDYNRDSARILYADLLSDMLRFDEAVSVLDLPPLLYSADAEYIRAKCYYNLGGEYVQKAREKIDAARRIYPTDMRFAELFFSTEYKLNQPLLQEKASGAESEDISPLARKIADAFILAISSYKNPTAELELYAAIFAEGEKQIRLLKSFKARNLKAPLYAEYVLRTGLLDQNAALDEFFAFADKSISLPVVRAFVPLITEEQPKQDLYEYLNAYNGRILFDTEDDGIENLVVDYHRGRPSLVVYDGNQDDEFDWSADCDFGVPLVVHLADEGVDIIYGNWPWVQSARYFLKDDTELHFNLVAESFRWTPFVISPVQTIRTALNLDFFFPIVQTDIPPVSAVELLHTSSSYTLPSKERPNALITVSVLDGVAQLARYTVDDIMYAQTSFEGGIPVLRVVDTDGDGLFETTEFYGFSPDRNQKVISTEEEMQIITNLFGSPSAGTGFYVRMIQIDTNGDTLPDFTEEYLEGEGKIASWDTNGNGNWDTRYIKHPKQEDGVLREESLFHQPLTNAEVQVSFEDGIPVRVAEKKHNLADGENAERILSVIPSHIPDFYWIGTAGSDENAQKILETINQTAGQGVSIIAGNEKVRMLGVRIGKMVFAEMLPESTVKKDEKK